MNIASHRIPHVPIDARRRPLQGIAPVGGSGGCSLWIRRHLSAVRRNRQAFATLRIRRRLGWDPVATQMRQAREG